MAAFGLAATVAWTVAQLVEAGIPATAEPDQAQLPGVLVYPQLVEHDRYGHDTTTITLDVVLVASGVGSTAALAQLDALAAAVGDVLPIGDLRAVSVVLPSQAADPLPALTTTVQLEHTADQRESTP